MGKPKKAAMARRCIFIPDDLYQMVAREAVREHRSTSAQFRVILEKRYAQDVKPERPKKSG